MGFGVVDSFGSDEVGGLLGQVRGQSNQSPLSSLNLEEIQRYVGEAEGFFRLVKFDAGDYIVENGSCAFELGLNKNYTYSVIPLMLITSGSVNIVENDKAVKRKLVGDFIGDFEVAHVLNSGRTERVGRWNVIANAETEVLIFDDFLIKGQGSANRFADFLVDLARKEIVPTTVSDLPLLDWTAKHFSPGLVEDTMLLISTHLLPSNVALIRHLTALIGYENVVVLEKAYSTVRSCYNQIVRTGATVIPVLPATGLPYELAIERSVDLLWNQVVRSVKDRGIQRIVIFDDGGALMTTAPLDRLRGIQVSGFEQTTSGITKLRGLGESAPPVVNIAGTAAKRRLEARFIGEAIVAKLESLRLANSRIGIIGMGSIGMSIAAALNETRTPIVYDFNEEMSDSEIGIAVEHAPSLDALLDNSDVIIGCTGTDCLQAVALDRVRGKKLLISASSSDVEFFSLLNMAGFPDTGFGPITVQVHSRLTTTILNGGFPINFDRATEWESPEDIQLTRSLLYLGFAQSLRLNSTEQRGQIVDLNQNAERRVVDAYMNFKTRNN